MLSNTFERTQDESILQCRIAFAQCLLKLELVAESFGVHTNVGEKNPSDGSYVFKFRSVQRNSEGGGTYKSEDPFEVPDQGGAIARIEKMVAEINKREAAAAVAAGASPGGARIRELEAFDSEAADAGCKVFRPQAKGPSPAPPGGKSGAARFALQKRSDTPSAESGMSSGFTSPSCSNRPAACGAVGAPAPTEPAKPPSPFAALSAGWTSALRMTQGSQPLPVPTNNGKGGGSPDLDA